MTAQDQEIEDQEVDVNEHLRAIASDLESLVANGKTIDESKAKSIRRRWESIADKTVDDPALFTATKDALEQLREQIRRQVEKRDRLYARLLDDLGKCEQAVKDGHLKQALSIEQSVSSRLSGIEGLSDQRRKAVSDRMETLAPQLSKLKQWRHWGTSHARENLIAEIEALIGSKKSPVVIAREVQKARQVWKSWDRSGDSAPKALWAKFDEICTRAYEPCQKHFAAQAEERAKNLKLREEICGDLERIEADTEWKAPDWREIDKRIQVLRQNYRRVGPVDRQRRNKIEARYASADEKLEGRLSRERTRNSKKRIALTEEVVSLKDTDDLAQAIERVKELQKEWRPTVLSSRRDERKLWQRFRAACDDVFALRDAARQSQNEQQNENAKKRSMLLDELESEMQSSEEAARDLVARLPKIREQWTNAGDVGARNRSDLDKRYRKLVKALESKEKAIKRHRAQEADNLLASVDALLAEHETAIVDGEDYDKSVAASTPIATRWPDISSLSNSIRDALESRRELVERFESGEGFDENDRSKQKLAEKDSRCQALCLALEVAADIESPPAYAKARMQLKVERLNQAMSGGGARDGTKHGDDDPRQLLRDYWCLGLVTPTCRRETQERVQSIAEKFMPDLKIDASSLAPQSTDEVHTDKPATDETHTNDAAVTDDAVEKSAEAAPDSG